MGRGGRKKGTCKIDYDKLGFNLVEDPKKPHVFKAKCKICGSELINHARIRLDTHR